jgi:hypothetical protein
MHRIRVLSCRLASVHFGSFQTVFAHKKLIGRNIFPPFSKIYMALIAIRLHSTLKVERLCALAFSRGKSSDGFGSTERSDQGAQNYLCAERSINPFQHSNWDWKCSPNYPPKEWPEINLKLLSYPPIITFLPRVSNISFSKECLTFLF